MSNMTLHICLVGGMSDVAAAAAAAATTLEDDSHGREVEVEGLLQERGSAIGNQTGPRATGGGAREAGQRQGRRSTTSTINGGEKGGRGRRRGVEGKGRGEVVVSGSHVSDGGCAGDDDNEGRALCIADGTDKVMVGQPNPAPVVASSSSPSEAFPYMPMLTVMVIVACDNIAFTQIFPYLAFLIVHLNMVEFDYQVGPPRSQPLFAWL